MDLGSVVVWPRRFEHQQLIPDCWYVPDKLRTGASNLGSVRDIGILDNNQLAHWS